MPPPSAPPGSSLPTEPRLKEIRLYQHSQLFYWWPVWVCGFIMAIWTYVDGHRLAIVPNGTKIERIGAGNRYQLEAPEKSDTSFLNNAVKHQEDNNPAFPLHVSQNSRIGAVFVIVSLLVIVITTMTLRGLWSVIVIVTIILLSIILALSEMWDRIFQALGNLHIHINAAGYLVMSIGLFVMWMIAFFFFDRQTYMIFTSGQLKVCLEIGGGETAYDTTGMTIQKYRDDLFRHWILGLGSGDLTVRTSGAQAHEFQMHNVLNVSTRLREIEEMQREKQTVQVK
jgi:uncharacterized membrane protein YkgB